MIPWKQEIVSLTALMNYEKILQNINIFTKKNHFLRAQSCYIYNVKFHFSKHLQNNHKNYKHKLVNFVFIFLVIYCDMFRKYRQDLELSWIFAWYVAFLPVWLSLYFLLSDWNLFWRTWLQNTVPVKFLFSSYNYIIRHSVANRNR